MRVTTPVRAAHTYTQHLQAPPQSVFPLLCPVREIEWVEGWSPSLVVSESGVAELDCVFVTEAEGREATWIISDYEPPHRIGMVQFIPEFAVIRLQIELHPKGQDQTVADVAYVYTALSEAGHQFVRRRTEAWYTDFMREEWEAGLNRYLGTREPRRQGSEPRST